MRLDSATFLSGLLFFLIGTVVGLYSLRYGMGSAGRLGAGAFPVIVSAILALVGLGAMASSAITGDDDRVLPFDPRAAGFITLAIVFGAATLSSLGIAIAIPGAVAIGSLAAGPFRPLRVVVSSAILTVFCWLVFIEAISVRLPVFPGSP